MWTQTLKDPHVVSKLAPDGTIIIGDSPEEFRRLIVVETNRWRALIKATGRKFEMEQGAVHRR